MKKISFDARELEHPKPLQLALKHLMSMDDESYLYMIHRKKPIPLIEIAKDKNFVSLIHEDTKGVWHILISKNLNSHLEDFLDV